jgi:Zn-dependent protease with chaperone function
MPEISDVALPTARPARLDPHALPAATTGRFLLLIATAVVSSVQVYAWLIGRLGMSGGARRRCVTTVRGAGAELMPDALIDWYSACSLWASLDEASVVLLMMLVFAVVTVGIYLVMPVRLARGLTPVRDLVDDDGIGHVARHIERIAAERTDRADVSIYVDTASGRGVNRAFGRVGRYAVVLDLSLLSRASRCPDDPRLHSVLRHELAHIRNRDIDLTYLTIAAWWGFLVAVALPFVSVAVNAPSELADFSWRLGALMALLWLVRAAVFRSREYYADVRSAAAPADEQALIDTLRTSEGGPRRRFGVGLDYLVYHPKAGDRTDVIRTGDRLFKLSPGVAAATGGLVGLAYPPTDYLVSMLMPDRLYEPGWICGLLFGLLVAAVLTGSVWRAALWTLVDGHRSVFTLPSAGAFTVALLVCLLIASPLPGINTWTNVMWQEPLVAFVLAVMLLASVHTYLRWTLLCASSWLPIAGRPRRAYRFGVAQSAVVIGIWLSAWFEIVGLVGGIEPNWPSLALATLAIGFNPLFLLTIPWACAYPLATWQSRHMAARAGAYQWWRPGRGDRPVIGGARTPLAAVSVTAAAIVVLYGVSVVPLYPDIRFEVERLAMQIHAPAATVLPLLRLLLLPVVAGTVVCLVVLGLVIGGRRRTSQAVASGGAALLLASIGVFVLLLVHLTTASPIVRSLFTLLTGLSGMSLGAPLPADRPLNAALGLMILAVLAGLFIIGIPAVMLGSLVRAAWPNRGSGRAPGRPLWLTAVLTAPLLVAGGALGYVGWIEWRLTDSVVVSDMVDHRAIEGVLDRPWPRAVPLDGACTGMVGTGVGLATSTASGDLDLSLAYAAGHARSAEDRTLRTMGEGIVESLRKSQVKRAARGFGTALRYCGDALT